MSATRGNLKRCEESLGEREVTTLTGQDILTHIGQRKAGPATVTIELGFLDEVLAAGRSLWSMTIPDVATATRPVLRRAGAIAKPVSATGGRRRRSWTT